ncbi:hypothetical protein BDZ89DRAFT_1114459 [Hymenopellis radicata]|nr:hypothetical protein BDZ89DRAFT_1114459 [Hymenopellis radicata]
MAQGDKDPGDPPSKGHCAALTAMFSLMPNLTSLKISFDRSRSWGRSDQSFFKAFGAFLRGTPSLNTIDIHGLRCDLDLQQMFLYLENTTVKQRPQRVQRESDSRLVTRVLTQKEVQFRLASDSTRDDSFSPPPHRIASASSSSPSISVVMSWSSVVVASYAAHLLGLTHYDLKSVSNNMDADLESSAGVVVADLKSSDESRPQDLLLAQSQQQQARHKAKARSKPDPHPTAV